MEIHQKIEELVAKSGQSLRQTAIGAGLNYSTLHNAIDKKRKISFEDIAAIADYFSVPIKHFDKLRTSQENSNLASTATAEALLNSALKSIETAKQTISKEIYDISLEAFLDWWYANSGRLENFEAIANRVDIFHPPDSEANVINPASVGSSSLAAICFEIEHQDQLARTLDGFTPQLNIELVRAHHRAHQEGEPVISHPSLNETLLNGKTFQQQYRRGLTGTNLQR